MRRAVIALSIVVASASLNTGVTGQAAVSAQAGRKAITTAEHWVPTWGTAQQLVRVAPPAPPTQP
jgi:hypothetical protein